MNVLRKSKEMTLLTQSSILSCSRFFGLFTTSCQPKCACLGSTLLTQPPCPGRSHHHLHHQQRHSELLKLLCSQIGLYCQKNIKYSSYKGNFIAKFSEEIDLDALREMKVRELKNSGKHFHVHDVVKQIIADKCDETISNLQEEDKKKLKVIQLEHDFLFSEGYSIPSAEEMTSENWLEALNLSSKQRRLRYYISWQKKLFMKENAKIRKTERPTQAIEPRMEQTEINDNKILLRVYDSTMKRRLNYRLASAMQFGIPLVLDMAYDDFMPSREVRNTASQIHDLYCLNRSDEPMPFHLHLTGCPTDNPMYRTLQLIMQDDPHLMATVTPQSYLDVFDKDQLVYLSPNGKHVMREFDPNAVYIVGAFNDKATQKPVSYARAKEQGIKCQRLPLDQYLKWNVGSKSLTLNQVMSILLSLKNGHSWPEALKAVPSRKYKVYGGR